jgi:hypothetical protein
MGCFSWSFFPNPFRTPTLPRRHKNPMHAPLKEPAAYRRRRWIGRDRTQRAQRGEPQPKQERGATTDDTDDTDERNWFCQMVFIRAHPYYYRGELAQAVLIRGSAGL